jgi:heme/copper-type cytochrome/quinol oxidase subunit 2
MQLIIKIALCMKRGLKLFIDFFMTFITGVVVWVFILGIKNYREKHKEKKERFHGCPICR